MSERIKMLYEQNPGIEAQKTAIARLLKITSLGNCDAFHAPDHIGERDILFGHDGLADKMLESLKNAILPENVYRMEYLSEAYQKFVDGTSASFQLEEIFDEGWLIRCRGEWTFNISYKSHYEKIDHLPSEKDTQILSFLKELSKLPYRSQMRLRAPEQAECGEIADIFDVTDEGIFLNPYEKYWPQLGDAILGKWWDEIIETTAPGEERERQIEHWSSCWEFLERCQRPDRFCEHIQELFEICLEKLEAERSNTSWELIEKIFRRRLYLEHNPTGTSKYSDFLQDFPTMPFARILSIESENYFYNLSEPVERLSRLYWLCMRQYGNVGRAYRIRFRQCFHEPWGYIHFYHFVTDVENIQLMTDCLGDAGLYVPAVSAIWRMSHTFVTCFASIGGKVLDELNHNLYEILGHGLKWEEQEMWLSAAKDLIWFLNRESRWYDKDESIGRTGVQKYMKYIHGDYLKWYEMNILPQEPLHEEILQFFYHEFEKSGEREVVGSFAGYTVLLGMQTAEERNDRLFEAYQKFLKRAWTEDTLVSVLSWTFWLEAHWTSMMQEVASDRRKTDIFLNLLRPGLYKEQAEVLKKRSSGFNIETAAMIQMYFMTILFLEARGDMAEKYRIKAETVFVECFLGFQKEQCDLFEPETIRILGAEIVIRRCMEILPMLQKEKRAEILSEMRKKFPEKLIFLLQYIQNPDIRKEWIRLLYSHYEEDYAKNIYYIPTYKQIIDCLLEICFRGEDEDRKLIHKAGELLDRFRQIVRDKGSRMEKEYAPWIQSAIARMKILMHEEDEILSDGPNSVSIFYKALLYLEQEALDSLKKAEELYGSYLCMEKASKSNAAHINYFAACVRICTHMDITGEEKNIYLERAEKAAKEIRERFYLTLSEQKILFSNELFLYATLNDHLKFWRSAVCLPPELKYELSCAGYIVQMLILEKEVEKAEEYLHELSLRYGRTDEIERLQKQAGEAAGALEWNAPSCLNDEELEISKYRNVLNAFKGLTETESALVRLQKDHLKNPVEANLLEFVLNASQKMEQYSDYLVYDAKTPFENVYSKFVQILFNQRGKEIWDFYLMDQTLEGTAKDELSNHYQSVGVVDLFIYHKNDPSGIIEAIKLQGADRSNIEEHIRKIPGYNFANVPTAFLLILADMSDPGEFWKKYEKDILPSIMEETKDNSWHITEQVPGGEIELIEQNLVRKPLYLCMTSHTCSSTGHSLHLYHIMVDIRKAAAKQEAVESRRKRRKKKRH